LLRQINAAGKARRCAAEPAIDAGTAPKLSEPVPCKVAFLFVIFLGAVHLLVPTSFVAHLGACFFIALHL